MLSRLDIELKCPADIKLRHSLAPLFQAVLMENIAPENATKLHEQGMNPYSQYATRTNDGYRWTINCLSGDAYNAVIAPLLSPGFSGFHLNKVNADFTVHGKKLSSLQNDALTEPFYSTESDRIFRVHFMTPAAFKSGGQYVFYPEPRLLLQSLMLKYAAAVEVGASVDPDMLSTIETNAKIIRYRLRSVFFPLERASIPSFVGEIFLKVEGAQALVNYVRLLLTFGEYSGIGIKCSMGMGAISLIDKEEGEGDGNRRDAD
jgi:CRISPR-associated endoribonuclease Cas6